MVRISQTGLEFPTLVPLTRRIEQFPRARLALHGTIQHFLESLPLFFIEHKLTAIR